MDSREITRRPIDMANPEQLAFSYVAQGRRYTDIITSCVDWEFESDQRKLVEFEVPAL